MTAIRSNRIYTGQLCDRCFVAAAMCKGKCKRCYRASWGAQQIKAPRDPRWKRAPGEADGEPNESDQQRILQEIAALKASTRAEIEARVLAAKKSERLRQIAEEYSGDE